MNVQRIADGLWRWTGRHEEWGDDVGCVYLEGDDAIVLVDPLVPPEASERFHRALDGDVERLGLPVAIVITVFWHARSARELARRHRARVFASAGARSAVARRAPVTHSFRVGDVLPGGLVAMASGRGTEVVLWHPAHRSLIIGDVVLGATDDKPLRLCPESWLPGVRTHGEIRKALRPLLSLPVERLLVAHGEPVLSGGRRALRRLLER